MARSHHIKKEEELNPALAPLPPDPPHEKCYEVTGEATVFGFAPGEKFNATLSFEQESDLTTYGHLTVVSEEPNPKVADEGVTVAEDSDDSANDNKDKE